MANVKSDVGRALMKKRVPNRHRAANGDQWVGQFMGIRSETSQKTLLDLSKT